MPGPHFIGTLYVWGIPTEQRLLIDAPPGHRRFRFRAKAEGKVFIRTYHMANRQMETRAFLLYYPNGTAGDWGLVEVARNVREL